MISSPIGIESLGALGRMVLSSTSVFGEVESFFVVVGLEVWSGLVPWAFDGDDLEDMAVVFAREESPGSHRSNECGFRG